MVGYWSLLLSPTMAAPSQQTLEISQVYRGRPWACLHHCMTQQSIHCDSNYPQISGVLKGRWIGKKSKINRWSIELDVHALSYVNLVTWDRIQDAAKIYTSDYLYFLQPPIGYIQQELHSQ